MPVGDTGGAISRSFANDLTARIFARTMAPGICVRALVFTDYCVRNGGPITPFAAEGNSVSPVNVIRKIHGLHLGLITLLGLRDADVIESAFESSHHAPDRASVGAFGRR